MSVKYGSYMLCFGVSNQLIGQDNLRLIDNSASYCHPLKKYSSIPNATSFSLDMFVTMLQIHYVGKINLVSYMYICTKFLKNITGT